jgi:transcriptional regulator with XRE-family HTH domain
MPVIRARVKEAAGARGWDAAQLAAQAGVDPQAAQSLFDGRPVTVDLAILSRLSQVFGVLPHELIESVEEKQPSAADAGPSRSI